MTRAQAHAHARPTASDEARLVARLRAGDVQAFEALVEEYYAAMLSVARGYVRSRAVAEEVVQEAWLGVLRGLDRFEGRSSLKTWIMRILVNIAMTRGAREARSQPFSSFAVHDDEPAVDADRFRAAGDGFAGHWRAYPRDWNTLPDGALLGRETLGVVMKAIEQLPDAQERITGAYALGPEAGEWLQQATLAIRAAVPLEVIEDVIQPFPTFSEIFLHALTELRARVPAAV